MDGKLEKADLNYLGKANRARASADSFSKVEYSSKPVKHLQLLVSFKRLTFYSVCIAIHCGKYDYVNGNNFEGTCIFKLQIQFSKIHSTLRNTLTSKCLPKIKVMSNGPFHDVQ